MKTLLTILAAALLGQVNDKLTVPELGLQRKNEKTIRELLREQYQKKDPNSRRLLARTLMDTAAQEKDFDLVFSFYREAADVAAEAMDFETAMSALDHLEKMYRVEPDSPLTGATFSQRHELRKALLKKAQKTVQSPDDAQGFVKAALKLADLYLSEDAFDDCLETGRMAEAAAQASQEKGLQGLAHGYVRAKTAFKKEHDKVAKAHLRALADPTDPEAAQTWGQFLGFVLGDWARAVEWISKGKDGPLKEVCKKEVAKAAPLELADDWAALAAQTKGPEQARYRARALSWTEAALSGASGADRLKIDRKAEDLKRALGIVDLLKIVDPARDYSGRGSSKGGSAKLDGGKLVLEGSAFENGLLEFPYIPPTEYTLTVVARHAGGAFRPFAAGLAAGDRQWAVLVGLSNATLGALPGIQNVDGKAQPLDEESRVAASVPLGSSATYVFTVRPTGFTVSVNGREVIDWAGDPKRLSIPEAMAVGRKNTLFLCTPGCRYEIEKAVITPIQGLGQKLR